MTEDRAPYNIAAHMGTIKTRNGMQQYLAVKWRVLWLRNDHPGASIVTEKVDGGVEAGWVEFKCTVTLPDGTTATDYGSETKQDFPDFYEKAATKATGRALALLGFGTDAAPDLDEGEPLDGAAASKAERADRRAEAQPTQMRDYERRSRASSPAPDGGVPADRPHDGTRRVFKTEELIRAMNEEYRWQIAPTAKLKDIIDDIHAEYAQFHSGELVPFETDKEGKQTRFPSTVWRYVVEGENERAKREAAAKA